MVDQQLFRSGMARLCAAVNVITTAGTAGRHAMVASAVSSVSDAPPSLLVCVNRNARANALIAANGAFCISVLATDHASLADHICRSPTIEERLSHASAQWTEHVTGSPALANALVTFDCTVLDVCEVGTHSIFIGLVQHVDLGPSADPLLYFQRSYLRASNDA